MYLKFLTLLNLTMFTCSLYKSFFYMLWNKTIQSNNGRRKLSVYNFQITIQMWVIFLAVAFNPTSKNSQKLSTISMKRTFLLNTFQWQIMLGVTTCARWAPLIWHLRWFYLFFESRCSASGRHSCSSSGIHLAGARRCLSRTEV